MLPRRTRSTLFPYTTLFRSGRGDPENHRLERGADKGARVPSPAEDETTARENFGKRKTMKNEKIDRLLRSAEQGDEQTEADRKSTRLNSSHSQISYAVFCLK